MSCDHDRLAGLLIGYAGGMLDAEDHVRIERHLEQCSSCQAELAGWRAVRQVLFEQEPALAPPAHVLATVLERIETPASLAPARRASRLREHDGRPGWAVRHAWLVVGGQVGIVRRQLWLASSVVMAIAVVVALSGVVGGGASLVMQLVAPLVAAFGVSLIYAPEVDPSLELARSTPTSPWLVLMARLALVVGYDLFLAVVATVAISAFGPGGNVGGLILDWLGPMLVASSLALWLSVRWGPSVGISVSLLLWALRVLAALTVSQHVFGKGLTDVFVHGWSTNAVTLAVAALLLGVAVAAAQREVRLT